MLEVLGRVVRRLGLVATVLASICGPASAGVSEAPSAEAAAVATSLPPAALASPPNAREAKRREQVFEIEDGLGYLKLGRFEPPAAPEPDDDWFGRRSRWVGLASRGSLDRTFMALEAGKKQHAGVRGFVSAAGSSASGELDPHFTASAYQRLAGIGPVKNVVASASAGTGHAGDRRIYTYTGSGRFSLGPFSLLGHGARVDTEMPRGTRRSWSARAEAGWLVAGRLDAKLGYEWLDPNDERPGDERRRIGVRLDPVLHERIRTGVCYRKLTGPDNRPGANADEVALELALTF
jgi:hypothetical protein